MTKTHSLPEQAFLIVGSMGPCGYLPASGTATVALLGLPLFYATRQWSPESYAGLAILTVAAAVGIHGVGDRLLGVKDSGLLVWDELAGFLIAVMFVPFTWQLAVLAFLLERGIDVAKVPPARHIEDHWPGGWGVVGDDVVAGLYTCGLLHLLLLLVPGWLGVH